MRGAFTLVEALVVCALCALVIASALAVHGAARRAEPAGELAIAMQGAQLVAERIADDLAQAGLAPGSGAPVRAGRTAMAFHVARFDGPRIRLHPVRWSARPSPGGHLHLVREEWAGGTLVTQRVMREVALGAVSFRDFLHPAGHGRYVAVALTALSGDGPGARAFSLRILQECAIPAQFGEPVLAASAGLVVEGALPPID